jgi:5-formyltetrahydrofolate cyclo-ligase
MRAVRRGIPDGTRRRDAVAAQERVLALPAVRDARTVMLFSSFGSEVDTGLLADRLHRSGVRVLLPFLDGRELHAAAHRAGDELVPSSYGAKEPAGRTPVDPMEIDVVVVPGLAFDREGYRVGYGAGYYDRFLSGLSGGTVRVGLCFSEQLVDAVPHGPADEPVDVIVTPTETIERPLRR